MTENANCSHCGAPLRKAVIRGVCQRCLLRAGLQNREQEIRDEVMQLSTFAERAAYIEGACGDDPALVDRVFAWTKSLSEARDPDGTGHPAAPSGDSPNGMRRPTSADGAVNFDSGVVRVSVGKVPNEAGESPELPDQRVIGRYKLRQKIGEGGFGTVYLAEQTEPVKRRVALKIIKLGMDTSQVIARFEAERQTLALMDHPNIAKVLDAGATDIGRPYFVMELVRGVPITRYCDQNQLSVIQRLKLFVEVCLAIQHAHQKGIIHRDIKPSNILVADHDGISVPKVIDFGIAKATLQESSGQTVLTQFHQFIGTPAYVSPEQTAVTNPDIDTRSDIYSLGVLLYELLTGSTPFDTKVLLASGLPEMQRTIREVEPLRPSTRLKQDLVADDARMRGSKSETRNPKFETDEAFSRRLVSLKEVVTLVRGDLDWIVMKCLQKDRTRRYATANGLATDVQRHLDNLPVLARPPSVSYRGYKLVRRNPVVTALGVVLFLGLAAAMIVGTSMTLGLARAKRESDRANRRLSETVHRLEWQKAEDWATEGRGQRSLAWFASVLRENPNDWVAASRTLSMLSLHSFALPIAAPFVHGGPVNSARFSPDGTQIMTASDDRTVRFWDTRNGQSLRVVTHAAGVSVASYLADGRRVLVATEDNIARVYDSRGGALFEASGLRRARGWGIGSGDGRWLFFFHRDNTISRWDLHSGQRMEPTLTVSSPILRAHASRLGECIALACEDRTVHILDASTGQPIAPPKQFDGPFESIRFMPDGRRLLIPQSEGQRVVMWDFRTANSLTEFIPPAPTRIQWMDFTPDGRRLLTHAWTDPLRIWDTQTLKPVAAPVIKRTGLVDFRVSSDSSQIGRFEQTGVAQLLDGYNGEPLLEPIEHQGAVRDLTFHPNGDQFVTAAQDGAARLWDIRMRKPPQMLLPHSSGGGEASFNREGTRVVVSVRQDAVQICDARTGQPLGPLLQHAAGLKPAHLWRASFSPDGSRILTAGREGLVRVWDAASFQPLTEFPVGHALVVAKFSPDGRFIVTGDRDGFAHIWDSDNGRLLAPPSRHGEEVIGLDFHPRGGVFVTASANGTARCWTLPTGQPALEPLKHRGIVWSAVFSPDGGLMVTASADRTAQVWEARTGRSVLSLPHESEVLSACFSPDGKRVLTTAVDGSARVWDALTGKPVSHPMRHAARIWMGCFSPDGRMVATGSDDRTARLWDAQTGLPLSDPLKHPGSLGRLAFSPDGKRLLGFGGEPPRFWDVVVAPGPVPAWFCELVEAVAGFRLGPDGETLPASPEVVVSLRKRLVAGEEKDFYARWAKWFLVDRMKDPVPNFSPE